MRYRVGTRGSALAVAQTEWVIGRLKEAYPEHDYEMIRIRTTGDRISGIPLSEIGTRGVFVDEIETALIGGRIDMAVHSMKDMPEECAEGLVFAKAWEREDPRDVLVLRSAASLRELPENAVICTGSLRRAAQLLKLRPDIKTAPIRGNIDTRLRKLNEPLPDGSLPDGIILAAAGLKRLGMEDRITQFFSIDEMIPAPAQGTLAIELRADDKILLEELNALYDETSETEVMIEREFLKAAGGSCRLPVGAYAKKDTEGWSLRAFFGNEDGSRTGDVTIRSDGPYIGMADAAAKRLRQQVFGC